MDTVKLRSQDLQKLLDEHGYIVLNSFLDPGAVSELTGYYKSSGLDSEKTQPNYLYAHPDKSREISAVIKQGIQKHFEAAFESGNLLGGVYMVKKPGPDHEVDFHQDWSLVDEPQYTSYNLWCPLVDTSRESGSLMIIDKSDKAGLSFRSSSFPPLEIKSDKKYERFIKKFDLRAGDAILYKHSMFHGSENNMDNFDRIAIACGVIPQKASFTYQHWNEQKSVVESYEVDNDFYIQHIFEVLSGKIPAKYKVVKETPFNTKPVIDEPLFYKQLKKAHGIKRFFFFN